MEKEVTLKTRALVVALAAFALVASGLSLVIGDNGYFSVVLLGGYHGTSNEGTKHGPSVCLWQAFGADDGETVKPGSREDSQTHTWLLPQCCFP